MDHTKFVEAEKLLLEGAKEKEGLEACEKSICELLVKRETTGDDLKCPLSKTWGKDKIKSVKEAQQDIYKKLRGQEFIVPGQAEAYLDNLIFKNLRKYDLSKVGRHKVAEIGRAHV